MNKQKKGYTYHKSICTMCGRPNERMSRKEECMCSSCKALADLDKSTNRNIRVKWSKNTLCQCCGHRIYDDISGDGLCSFCSTEYTAMAREYAWRKKPKQDLYNEILRIKKMLDDMEVVGTNLQNVRV